MTTTEPAATQYWHAQSAEQVCADLETDPARGLTPDAAMQRLARHGPNKLAEATRAEQLGYTRVYNVRHGITGWIAESQAVVKD